MVIDCVYDEYISSSREFQSYAQSTFNCVFSFYEQTLLSLLKKNSNRVNAVHQGQFSQSISFGVLELHG